MDRFDWLIVVSFSTTIFFGFLLIFVTTMAGAIICITLSIVSYMPLLFASCINKLNRKSDFSNVSITTPMRYNLQKMDSMNFWVSVTMTLFPITYLLAAVRAIDFETSAALFQLLSMAIKGFYGAILLDLQTDAVVVSNWTLQQEIRANNSRRSYLKYVFHEVRNPLNSLVLGIDILEQSATPRDEIERFVVYYTSESLFLLESISCI
jgi:signal transduction histidine kinase